MEQIAWSLYPLIAAPVKAILPRDDLQIRAVSIYTCPGRPNRSLGAVLDLENGDVRAMEKATFAAGCFWGIEAAFRKVKGVVSATVGYTGGHTKNPTYKEVCTDRTGHAEAVLVEYDPSQISYEDLLNVFWEIHDPTQLNRQGPDFGSQYRSAVFFHSPEQQAAALASKERLETRGSYKRPVVTEITLASEFWRAEEYHQQYFQKCGVH